MGQPILYILCGKVGAGKTTFAKHLESQGTLRLTQDERALAKIQDRRNPDDHYRVINEKILRNAEAEAWKEIFELAISSLRQGRSVVIDDGFWRKEERCRYHEHAISVGASCRLYYFPIEPDEQWWRLKRRNRGDLSLVHYISREDMEYLNRFFEPPDDEGAELVYEEGYVFSETSGK